MLTLASSIDSILIAMAAGPAVLAAYSLGVAVRGGIGSIGNNIYWVLWPQSVIEFDRGEKNKFSNDYFFNIYLLIITLITLLMGIFTYYVVLSYLPLYTSYLPTILVVIASSVPMAGGDFLRAQIILNNKPLALIFLTVLRIIIFIFGVFLLNFLEIDYLLSISYGAFFSFFLYMFSVSYLVSKNNFQKYKIYNIFLRILFSIIPLLSFTFIEFN
jgi:O-antigen/teichoic acid export membrane protein